jgi:hypothetical protein
LVVDDLDAVQRHLVHVGADAEGGPEVDAIILEIHHLGLHHPVPRRQLPDLRYPPAISFPVLSPTLQQQTKNHDAGRHAQFKNQSNSASSGLRLQHSNPYQTAAEKQEI